MEWVSNSQLGIPEAGFFVREREAARKRGRDGLVFEFSGDTMSDEEQAERKEYGSRLLLRILEKGQSVSPIGLGRNKEFWEELEPAVDMFLDAGDAYENGGLDKEELDTKAVALINHWRELAQKYGEQSGTETA